MSKAFALLLLVLSPATLFAQTSLEWADGSRFSVASFTATEKEISFAPIPGMTVTAPVPKSGTVTLSRGHVAAARFGDSARDERWRRLAATGADRDRVVVRRDDTLDYLAGSILAVTPETVVFKMADKVASSGTDIYELKRKRIYGLIFANAGGTVPEGTDRRETIHLRDDGELRSVATSENGAWRLASGLAGTVAENLIARRERIDSTVVPWSANVATAACPAMTDSAPGVYRVLPGNGMEIFAPAVLTWRVPSDAKSFRFELRLAPAALDAEPIPTLLVTVEADSSPILTKTLDARHSVIVQDRSAQGVQTVAVRIEHDGPPVPGGTVMLTGSFRK